jgi:hypothetical protein
MKQLNMPAMISLLLVTVTGSAGAQATADFESVHSISQSFVAAIRARDIEAMDKVWRHETYTSFIGPLPGESYSSSALVDACYALLFALTCSPTRPPKKSPSCADLHSGANSSAWRQPLPQAAKRAHEAPPPRAVVYERAFRDWRTQTGEYRPENTDRKIRTAEYGPRSSRTPDRKTPDCKRRTVNDGRPERGARQAAGNARPRILARPTSSP